MRIIRAIFFKTAAVFLFLPLLFSCSSPRIAELSGSTMGTYYSVKYYPVKGAEKENVVNSIDSLLLCVNNIMSTYLPNSELSRFNEYRDTTWFSCSGELAETVAAGITISQKSGGAYDITVGPLVNLWGFGPGEHRDTVPAPDAVRKIKEFVGYEKLSVKLNPPALKKSDSRVYVDLSSIAKGYGVDRIAEFLAEKNIRDFMVEIGGEVRTRGQNLGKEWKIGVATPDESRGIEGILFLNSMAVATSGDYYNYFEKEGKRYSHTINPKTGYPVTHKLASVTVLAEKCMIADAMATAIDVLGPDEGYKFAEREKLPVFLIVKGEQGYEEIVNSGMKKYLRKLQKGR